MSKTERRTADWAEDGDEDDPNSLPPPSVTKNPDGTETHISYRLHETSGKKLKTTRTIKRTLVTHRVNPRVAERRSWAKFGASAKDAAGPQSDTTSVGEDIQLHPRVGYKSGDGKDDAAGGAGAAQAAGGLSEAEKKKLEARNMTVKCRICNGDHFTARCPFKDTMAPAGEGSTADAAAGDPLADPKGGAEGAIKGKYIAPGKRGEGSGERMAGKYERDDLATLRVTNVSEYAEESELRDMFERCGRVTRVFLAKDRETGRAKGFAFVSFADRTDASKACAKMDGFGYNNLILRVEFAKKTT